MLAKMIRSELHEGFILCEGNGEHATMEYIPDIHDEAYHNLMLPRQNEKPHEN